MTPKKLKAWMTAKDRTATDVASAISRDASTIRRFLKTGKCQRSTRIDLERLVSENP